MSNSRLNLTTQWLIVALAFTIPMQVATNNLILVLLLLTALPLYGRALPEVVRYHPVARVAVALFGLLLLGTLWGDTPWREALGILGKYIDLALIPLFMLLLQDPVTRERSLLAFFSIMTFALTLSWAIGLHILPITPELRLLIGPSTLVENPSIFHSHITQGMLTSFACYLFALRARAAATPGQRLKYAALATLAGTNILFMLQGRTGYLVLFVLLGWFGWNSLRDRLQRQGKRLGWKAAVAGLLLPVMLLAITFVAVPRFHDRAALAIHELTTWQPGQDHQASSMGTRLDFYSNTLALIQQRPVFGYGTGGFADAFAGQTTGLAIMPTKNPHNEYLMQAVQLGIPGTLLLLLLFVTQWRNAPRLPAFEREAAQGLVLAYALTSLLNSMLLDHTEGLFFAFMTAWLFAPLSRHGQRCRPQ